MISPLMKTGEDLERTVPDLSVVNAFKGFTEEAFNDIRPLCDARVYRAGVEIYAMGQFDGAEFLVVLEGRLKLTCAHLNAGSMTVRYVEAGESFGLDYAMADHREGLENLTLAAQSESVVGFIDVNLFRERVLRRSSLAYTLMGHFANQLVETRDAPIRPQSSPHARIFDVLQTYVERDGVSQDWRVRKMPKHREIADKANTDETMVAEAIAALIRDGVVRRDYPDLVFVDIERFNQLISA